MNFKKNETAQKLRGGYYTPIDLAEFITNWVNEIKPNKVLEPSCGDGVFLDAMSKIDRFKKVDITGFELEPTEANIAQSKAKNLGLKSAIVNNGDFLEWALANFENPNARFDAIVGNPPFIRYQYLPKEFQLLAENIFKQLDLKFTKHTNAWVTFILASMKILREGGRLAMVVPAEIIHVTHAQSLRSYLGSECSRLVIIDPEELWFDDTLQGAVILLAEKKSSRSEKAQGLGIYPVKGREFLKLMPSSVFNAPTPINGKTVQGKWTRALLDLETRSLYDEIGEHAAVHQFKNIAKVDVGIVTGANKFFLVPDEIVKSFKLEKWAHPMFGRSEHCPGIIYDEMQHLSNAEKGNPTNFLWFNSKETEINDDAGAYIKLGELEKLHERYKCSVRSPWYTVPSVYSTEIGMLKRSHHTPRLILNRIGAYTTDTAYRIKVKNGVDAEQLVSGFINPLTALSAELEGRHYGGGVLELIPSEIERLLIPLVNGTKINLNELDNNIRTKSTDEVLAMQGKLILGGLGLSKNKQEIVLDGWKKLRDRRNRVSSEPPNSAG